MGDHDETGALLPVQVKTFVTGRAGEADQLRVDFDGSPSAKLSDNEGDSLDPLPLNCTPCQTKGTDGDNQPTCED